MREGAISNSARCRICAASFASSPVYSPRLIFFHKMFAHYYIIKSGATAAPLSSKTTACVEPSSSTTVLISTLASMTNGLNAHPALRAGGSRQVCAADYSSSPAALRPVRKNQPHPRPPAPGAGFHGVRLLPNGHAAPPRRLRRTINSGSRLRTCRLLDMIAIYFALKR